MFLLGTVLHVPCHSQLENGQPTYTGHHGAYVGHIKSQCFRKTLAILHQMGGKQEKNHKRHLIVMLPLPTVL